MSALQLACCSNLYRVVCLLIYHKADPFVQNAEGKSAFTIIQNNLLMMKLVKRSMISFVRDIFED